MNSSPFSDAVAAPVLDPVPTAPPPPPRAKLRAGRENDVVDGTTEYRLVPVKDLQEDPDNTRQTFRKVEELATNIDAVGLTQPIVARIDEDGALVIMDGARRFRAVQILGWELVPCLIRYGVKPSSLLATMLSVNSHRQDLDPIEEARGVRRYMKDHKLGSMEEAAVALGMSIGWVSHRLALLKLDDKDQRKVSAGTMTIGAGVKMSREKTGNTRVSHKARETARELPHFSDDHHLAGRARSRCRVHDFPKPLVGGVACGACWEIVIRLDEGRNPLPISGREAASA